MVTQLSAVPGGSTVSPAFPTGGNPWSQNPAAPWQTTQIGQVDASGLEPSQWRLTAETPEQKEARLKAALYQEVMYGMGEHLGPSDPIGFTQRQLGLEMTEWDRRERQLLQTQLGVDDKTFERMVPEHATVFDRSTWGSAYQNSPTGIYNKLLGDKTSSLLQSLTSKLPLDLQAQYLSQAATTGNMSALQALWTQGGGQTDTLNNLLNNVQGGAANYTMSPAELHPGLIGAGRGGGGGGGGPQSVSGTAGTGLATHPIYFVSAQGGVGEGDSTPQSAADAVQALAAQVKQDWSVAAANAKALVAGTGVAAGAWSSIGDSSQQIASSIASIPGAFSAYAMDLNSKMASSISGSWTLPTIGGPSGPQAGPGANPAGLPSGSTQGGANFAALQALADQITKEHPDLSADSQARLIQQGMRTNQDYLRVVGNLTDTSDDLRRQQEDAANQVQNWTNVVRLQGDAYASGSGALAALQDAQQNLTNVTNALAANVSATPISAPPPTPQQPSTPVPTTSQIANLTAGQFYTLNSAGELVVSTAQHLSGGPTGPTTAPLPPAPTVTAPIVTTPTPTVPTPTTPTVAGPVKIGTTAAGMDVYQMPDGSTVSVPKGSPPPTTTTAGKLAQGVQAGITLPAYVPSTVGPDVSTAIGNLGAPLIAQGDAVTVGRMASSGAVNLTANITLNNAASTPQLAAVLVRQIREEFRRQGTDVMRIGGI